MPAAGAKIFKKTTFCKNNGVSHICVGPLFQAMLGLRPFWVDRRSMGEEKMSRPAKK